MGGVPFQTRSSQPINVLDYSEDDLEEENEDEGDEEIEFDEDDVHDSVRMGAYHRDTPIYNLSSYPPPLFGCPQPGPGGLPSPPTPIPFPMSGVWRSPHYSPSFPRPGQFPKDTSTGSRPHLSRPLRHLPPRTVPLAEVPSPLEYLHVLPLSLIPCALAEVPDPLEYLHVQLPLLHHQCSVFSNMYVKLDTSSGSVENRNNRCQFSVSSIPVCT
ncbi:OLC1v1016829C1 [Oldenlandia corymbosa var. corymbosa]|uniref:OLC1v1016829C1 n=1 Tax=Oldenlandia corymbosa var. corymbosa TaxID=529605 RepID=A0AAV1E822_OLDCO|nr:OLC1v1016829C1 [Oldenlandia corymbosa var. corymbosa]